MRTSFVMAACALALAACDDGGSRGTDAGGTRDSGGGTMDAGRDTGTPGPDDSCADDDPTLTVGCNGGILGASQPAHDFGGTCTPSEENAEGSCTNANAVCWGDVGAPGVCLTTCTPSEATYVSTGDCPTGSRCFDLRDTEIGAALCFPDCNSGTDCATGACDGENSCVGGEPTAPPDGGMGDAGASDAGGAPDGGTEA